MSDKRFKNWKQPVIREGKLTKWNWMVQHVEGLKLGKYTDIGAFTYLNAKNGLVIEDDVQIGSHCAIYTVSTIDSKEGKVKISKGACIGTHSTVMPGVEIGENAVVGAYTFVNRDIPAGEVWVGVPARKLR